MATSLWLNRLHSFLTRRQPARSRSKSAPRFRPVVLFLEDRVLPSSYMVTNTGDNGGINPIPGAGTGTLRQAIVDADAAGTGTAANPDQILFNIPTTDPGYQSSTGAFTIQPLSALPAITDTVVVDGYTQPGSSPNTLSIGDNAVLCIAIDGSQVTNASGGLLIDASSVTVCGLDMHGFSNDEIVVGGSAASNGNVTPNPSVTGVAVQGCFLGTNISGTQAFTSNAISGGVEILSSGNLVGANAGDADVLAERNLISGNAVNPYGVSGDAGTGVYIATGSTNNVVAGNYLGTDRSGTTALANHYGVVVVGSGNTIGGTAPGTGNVISGNDIEAIAISGTQNTVAGNFVGTSASGLAGIGNGAGIDVSGNCNTIGGTAAAARNIISDNNNSQGAIDNGSGVYLLGSQHNLIEGNYIGTDITGTTGIYNPLLGAQNGVLMNGASYNIVGGTTPGAGNVMSGDFRDIDLTSGSTNDLIQGNLMGTNAGGTQLIAPFNDIAIVVDQGVVDTTIGGTAAGAGNVIDAGMLLGGNSLALPGSANTVIQGNFIGTDPTGTVLLGNSTIVIDSNGNTIGGTQLGAANVIAGNYVTAINIQSGTGNTIRGNSIHDNGLFSTTGNPGGIYLDSQGNANNNQALPVINGYSVSAAGTTLTGAFQSVPNTAFALDFYANVGPDATGYGEGQSYFGSTTVTTDGSGDATFTTTVAAPPAGQLYFTATATNLTTGDTSEFFTPGLNHLTFQPTITVTGGPFPYTGAPQPATVTVAGLDGASVSGSLSVTYNGSSTVPTAPGTYAVNVSFTSANPNYSNATAGGSITILPNTGILLLDPTGQALAVSGNAALNVTNNGAIVIDSSNAAAASASGNASVTATQIYVTGGVSSSGNAAFHGAITKGAVSMSDPLANLSAPSQPSNQFTAGTYSGPLQPGTYVGGIAVTGNNSVTMQPGIYYLKGSGLTVSGNASLTGIGVMLYITGLTGSSPTSVNVSGNASVTLTPPTSGAYQGIVLFQDRTSSAAIDVSGNATLKSTGTEYAPAGKVNLSGNDNSDNPSHTSLGSEWIVADLTLSGNAKFTISADANNRSANPNAFMVAGGPINLYGPVASLMMAQADAAVTTALGLWQAAGLDAGTLKALSQTKVTIAPLPAPYLGLAAPGVIYLDPNAEGYGWFTDDATAAAVPAGKIDLVTVVTHELGHLFGLMDGNSTALMAPTLAAAVRILPDAGDLLAPHTTLIAASVPTGVSEATSLQLDLDQPRQAASATAETAVNKHAAQAAALGTAANIDLGWLPLPTVEYVSTCVDSTAPNELQQAIDTVFETLVQSPNGNDFVAPLTSEASVADRLTDSMAEDLGNSTVLHLGTICEVQA